MSLAGEAWHIFASIVAPTAFGNAMEYLPVTFGLSMVGHQSTLSEEQIKLEVDAMMLARAYFNLVAMAPGFGIITPLRTLCPQAVGAGRKEMLPVCLQRALLLLALGALPVTLLLLFSERVLLFAGQDLTLAALAQPYCVRLLPQYAGCVGMSAVQRVYQAVGLQWSNTLICLVVCVAAPLMQWLLILRLGYGYLGAALGASAYNASYLFLQVPHLACVGHGDLFSPSAETLRWAGMRDYLRLMLPGFLMVCAEWWVLEAAVLLAGLLQPSDLSIGAFTITATLQALALMSWIGLAVAAGVTVGRHIGARDVAAARRAAACVLAIGLCLAAVWCACLVALREPIAQLFTASSSVNGLVSQLLPAVGVIGFLDATSNALGGVCSGLGLQRYAAASQLFGYYVVGTPVGAALAFGAFGGGREGVFGLWSGVGLSMLTAAVLQSVALARHDWACAAEAAQRRFSNDAPVAAKDAEIGSAGELSMRADAATSQEQKLQPVLRMEAWKGSSKRRTASTDDGVPLRPADEVSSHEELPSS